MLDVQTAPPLRAADEAGLLARLKYFINPIDGRYEDLRKGSIGLNILRDFTAGLIVAMVAIPLAMGFAMASGLRPEQGIVGGAVAGLVVDKIGLQARLDRGRRARGGPLRGTSRDISNAKQEIISYRKIIKPQRPALRLLERRVERFLPEELELYFDDLVDASERIWDLLDNYKEVVEALETTNEQVLLAPVQKDVLRILTVFSIVFLPATLIASLWGMNVGFPVAATRRPPRLRSSGSSSGPRSP